LRPTITEQLRQTRRILQDEIAPYIAEKHPAQILGYLLGNLHTLEDSWSRVLPFLHWDNTATVTLLRDLSGHVGPELAADIEKTSSAIAPDVLDVHEVERRNVALRDLLRRCVNECSEADLEPTRAHLVERSKRFPFRPAPRSLSSSKEK
jgi:hypothetical protein